MFFTILIAIVFAIAWLLIPQPSWAKTLFGEAKVEVAKFLPTLQADETKIVALIKAEIEKVKADFASHPAANATPPPVVAKMNGPTLVSVGGNANTAPIAA
jgi:hypothetical protein